MREKTIFVLILLSAFIAFSCASSKDPEMERAQANLKKDMEKVSSIISSIDALNEGMMRRLDGVWTEADRELLVENARDLKDCRTESDEISRRFKEASNNEEIITLIQDADKLFISFRKIGSRISQIATKYEKELAS